MSKLFSLCAVVFTTCSFCVMGQTTNKEAEEALTKGINAGKNKDFNSAIINYTKAIELDPKYVFAYKGRGFANIELKKHVEAIADYTKAIELDPKDADGYSGRGFAYESLGKTKEANADFAKGKALEK